ncbi:hypothetical protein MEU_01228 [Candida albicans P37005]|nr:hypothetical protein MEU_01228 [Candida albicans P37005]KHC60556.1 hypothetical protein MGC_01225 [Candida albicans P37039]
MSEKDLVQHYKVLKQFLAISDDQQSRSKSNSSRAQRAREKLLKLSSAQFKELSTDVYDELRRRIDESRSEPDYLLPKSSFHPKRNQARQKLASLPQTRFKDLVADISYEIERRDLHVERQSQHSHTTSMSSNGSQFQHERKSSLASSHHRNDSANGYHSRSASHHLNDFAATKEVDEEKESDSRDDLNNTSSKNITMPNAEASNQSIGIQPSQVVPTKANLDWSSDDEGDDEQEEEEEEKGKVKNISDPKHTQAEQHQNQHQHSNSLSNNKDINTKSDRGLTHDEKDNELAKLETLVNDLKNKLQASESERSKLKGKLESLQEDYNFSVSQNKSLSNELETLGKEKERWITKHDNLTKSMSNSDENLKEIERLKSINAALRLENQSLKNTSSSPRSVGSPPSAINAITTNSGNSGNSAKLSQKSVDEFLEKLETIQLSPGSTSNNPSTLELKNQIKLWQRRYEDSRSNAIARDIKKASLPKMELKPFVASHGLISIKLVSDALALIDSFLGYLVSEKCDSDILFEKISKLAIVINEIANQGDRQRLGSNEHSVMLREAVAYSLTATRYHATYKQLFPRYIVEKSIGELNCILCDLIAECKLNENSTNLRVLEVETKVPKKSVNEDFGVRPLRMANKLKVNQSQQEPTQKSNSETRALQYEEQSPFIEETRDKPLKSKANSAFTTLRAQREKAKEEKSPTNATHGTSFSKGATVAATVGGASIPAAAQVGDPRTKKSTHNVAFNDNPISISPRYQNYDSDENEDDLNDDVPTNDNFNAHSNKETKFDRKPYGTETQTNNLTSGALSTNTTPTKVKIGRSINEDSDELVSATNNSNFHDNSGYQQSRNLDSSNNFVTQNSGNLNSYKPNLDNSPVRKTSLDSSEDKYASPMRDTDQSFDNDQDDSFETAYTFGKNLDNVHDSNTRKEDVATRGLGTNNEVVPQKENFETEGKKKGSIASLASKYENNVSDQSTSRNYSPIKNKSDKSSQGVQELARRITSPEASPESQKSISQASKISPSKKGVLDKVKQFESPQREDVPSSPSPRKSPGQDKVPFKSMRTSLESSKPFKNEEDPGQLSAPFSAIHSKNEVGEETSKKEIENSAAAETSTLSDTSTSSSAPVKSKGLFQSLKDRFTGETKKEEEEEEEKVQQQQQQEEEESAKHIESSQSDATISDNEKQNDTQNENLMNTVETSPPKDVNDEIISKPVQVQYPEQKTTHSGEQEVEKSKDLPIERRDVVTEPSTGIKHEPAESNKTEPKLQQQKSLLQKSKQQKPVTPESEESYSEEETEEEIRARQRQEYRKSMAAATFNVDLFDIDDPDNTLTQVLLYLEHQTVQVINTIQSLLAAIKKPNATRGELREKTKAITIVISQMTEATNTSMNQTRNAQLKEHGSWVVRSLEDCYHRMNILCKPGEKPDTSFADKNFKQRLAGISFDIAKCTKELVKTVEEASLKEDIAYLDARISQNLE